MKVLVDSSIWVDHLRSHENGLADLLTNGQVVCHPLIIGELAWGLMKERDTILRLLRGLPRALVAQDEEVLHLVSTWGIPAGTVGYVGAHLMTATMITPDTVIWTRDSELKSLSQSMELDFSET